MKRLFWLTGLALLATACASEPDDEPMAPSGAAATAPPAAAATSQSEEINCATAQADLRVLKSEQSHAMERAMGGGSTMVPSGLVTEPEFSASPVGAGEYSDYLSSRISEIQEACGL
jgi:hypothetical protein